MPLINTAGSWNAWTYSRNSVPKPLIASGQHLSDQEDTAGRYENERRYLLRAHLSAGWKRLYDRVLASRSSRQRRFSRAFNRQDLDTDFETGTCLGVHVDHRVLESQAFC